MADSSSCTSTPSASCASTPSSARRHTRLLQASSKPPVSSIFTRRRGLLLAYGFTFLFVTYTSFVVLINPSFSSSSSSSPNWFQNLVVKTTANVPFPYGSNLSSFFSRFLSTNSSSQQPNPAALSRASLFIGNETVAPAAAAAGGENNHHELPRGELMIKNTTTTNNNNNINVTDEGNIVVEADQQQRLYEEESPRRNGNKMFRGESSPRNAAKMFRGEFSSRNADKMFEEQQSALKRRKEKAKRNSKRRWKKKNKKEKFDNNFMRCNLFEGRWVRDNSYPLFPPGSCPYIDESFNCFLNGRPDNGYEKYRWQPRACSIPRMNPRHMLEILRGKRLAFIGDSLNRNMWESMVCILRNAVEDKRRVFEASGSEEFRTEDSYSFVFKDYNCSVEYFQSQFLVEEWEMPHPNGTKKETLRIDLLERASDKYKSADVLIFNTGHWWTHEKTASGKSYYQEGSHVHDYLDVNVAYEKAMLTWSRWVDQNIDPSKTLVIFRGYSVSHFRGGEWSSGGKCNDETEPITDEALFEMDPPMVGILESVLSRMRTPVFYLNVTRMTNFRKDAHPSAYRMQNLSVEEIRSQKIQDCSHWCLPGVPDTWNEIVYSQLLQRHKRQKQQKEQKRQILRKKHT